MMRRQAYQLLSLAATLLIVSGCSPFHTKVNRRASHEVADAATVREAETASRSGLRLPAFPPRKSAADKPQPEEGKIRQLTALARLSERRDQHDQAEEAYRELINLAPDNPLPYHRLGVMKAKDSRFDEAERLLAKAYELSPTDPKLLSDIGYLYYLKSDEEKSEEFYRYALRFDPDNRSCCNNLGILLGEQGKYSEAETFFRRGCKEPAEVAANMAFVYSQRGELSQAIDSYSRALTLDNTLKPAAHGLLNLARLQERAESEARRSVSQEAQAAEPPQPVVTDLATDTAQPATVAAPAPASQPVTATQPATATQLAAAQPTGSGLLASLSNFAGSLTRPAGQSATAQATDTAPPTTDDARRQMAVRALFTTPDEVAAAEPDQASPSDAAVAPPEPKYAAAEEAKSARTQENDAEEETPQLALNGLNRDTRRLRQRLKALRTEEEGGVAAPRATGQRKALTPPSSSAVSVRISDLTDNSAAATGETDDASDDASRAETSSRRVKPASFTPTTQDTSEEGVEDFLDTWLDLTSRMPTVSTDPAESSRRVKP